MELVGHIFKDGSLEKPEISAMKTDDIEIIRDTSNSQERGSNLPAYVIENLTKKNKVLYGVFLARIHEEEELIMKYSWI